MSRRTKTTESMGPYYKRNKRLRANGYSSYKEYLASPLWAKMRKEVLERDNHTCVACGSNAHCVHHTNYKTKVLMGSSKTNFALVSLCNRCHKFIEFNKDGTKTNLFHSLKKLRFKCRQNNGHLPGRCKKCMHGGGSKIDGLCVRCRRRKSPASDEQPKVGSELE